MDDDPENQSLRKGEAPDSCGGDEGLHEQEHYQHGCDPCGDSITGYTPEHQAGLSGVRDAEGGSHYLIYRHKVGQESQEAENKEEKHTQETPQNDGIERLPKRVEQYGLRRKRAREMVEFLSEKSESILYDPEISKQDWSQAKDLVKLYTALEGCGNWLQFDHYWTVDKVRLTGANFCKRHLCCPLCAARRGSKQVQAYESKFRALQAQNANLRPYMVTFTVKNGDDLAERFESLQNSLKKLHVRRRDHLKKGRAFTESSKALGAVWSYEVTNKGNGWHPHAHAVWLCEEEPSMYALREEWKEITNGESFMVDVRPIEGDPADGFAEVFKYALKMSDLTLADNLAAYWVLHGRRLVGSFGSFRGVEVPPELLDEPLADDLPYIRMLFRYVIGSGYQLIENTETGIKNG